MEAAFKDRNYGVGCPGGVEVVAHSLRDTIQRHQGSDLALLKIDFRNAFNEISRAHFVSETCKRFPFMSAWTEWCYGAPTMLLYDHKHIIESECGVQQGDPLGPLYFCCGIMMLVNEIDDLNPVYNKWDRSNSFRTLRSRCWVCLRLRSGFRRKETPWSSNQLVDFEDTQSAFLPKGTQHLDLRTSLT